MNWAWLDWVAVALVGGVVGTSELISRYKDDPWAAIRSWPARFYIAANSAASIDRKSVVWGKRVDFGGRRIVKKNNKTISTTHNITAEPRTTTPDPTQSPQRL